MLLAIIRRTCSHLVLVAGGTEVTPLTMDEGVDGEAAVAALVVDEDGADGVGGGIDEVELGPVWDVGATAEFAIVESNEKLAMGTCN